jgi:hypothetical protein
MRCYLIKAEESETVSVDCQKCRDAAADHVQAFGNASNDDVEGGLEECWESDYGFKDV